MKDTEEAPIDTVSIGIDLGGTKIEAAVVATKKGADGPEATILLRQRVPTEQEQGYDAIVAKTAAFIVDIARAGNLDARAVPVGVGMPGGITRREGLVKNSNTVCLNGRPFRADLQRALGRDVAFENDANCFALAEATVGAARPYREGIVFGVILGTGVGGGVVTGGRLWPGAQGIAGEWGHHDAGLGRDRVCYCGNRGCVELYASGPAVEASYAGRAGVVRPLAEIVERRAFDGHAGAAVEELVQAVGRGLANVIDILDPSAIVLGGGVSNLDLLYEEGTSRVAGLVFNDELVTPILRNALGDSAGVVGAALLE